jgi:hypothetical protein
VKNCNGSKRKLKKDFYAEDGDMKNTSALNKKGADKCVFHREMVRLLCNAGSDPLFAAANQ